MCVHAMQLFCSIIFLANHLFTTNEENKQIKQWKEKK